MRYIILMRLTYSCHGTEEFPFFVTDDGSIYQDTTNGTRFIRPEKIKEAMQAGDSRPVALDSEGHWGQIDLGCQTSLRFEKTSYPTNGPVVAKLIVRDVGDQVVEFFFRPADPAVCIVVIGPNSNRLQRLDVDKSKDPRLAAINTAMAKPVHYSLNPGTQRKFELDLKSSFDFSMPGTYTIYASPKVIGPARGAQYKEIPSERISLSIVDSRGTQDK